jgi:hypothetical protein
MAHRKEPTENDAKGAENGDAAPSMERFKNLTKGLVKVTREELAEAERRYEGRRDKKTH